MRECLTAVQRAVVPGDEEKLLGEGLQILMEGDEFPPFFWRGFD